MAQLSSAYLNNMSVADLGYRSLSIISNRVDPILEPCITPLTHTSD